MIKLIISIFSHNVFHFPAFWLSDQNRISFCVSNRDVLKNSRLFQHVLIPA